MLAVGADASLRLAHIEKLPVEMHCAGVGQDRESCPRAQDLPVSASKKRRLRATQTRKRLWQASVASREDTTKHDPTTADVDILDATTSWQTMDCLVPDEKVINFQHDEWTANEIESWIRETLRAANEAALAAVSRAEALSTRSNILSERWEKARPFVPASLREAIWSIVSEPLDV